MSNLKPPYLIGAAAVGLGLGLLAAVAFAADGPRIERDVTIRLAPAFADIDANKNGNISQSEFNSFHAEHKLSPDDDDLPPPPPPPGGKRMRMMIMGADGLDANKDGKVSFAEFSGPMKAHFDELDANKDGVLDDSEQPKGRTFERRMR